MLCKVKVPFFIYKPFPFLRSSLFSFKKDDDNGDNGALDNDDLLDEEAVLAVKSFSKF